jgi:hypothetical protein
LRLFCLTALLLMMTASLTAAKDWRGLTPLKSTRAEVERLLRAPENPGGPRYKSGEALVDIDYSAGVCGDDSTWQVPRDTVVSITVHPRNRSLTPELLFKELQMDPNTFHKDTYEHDHSSFYWNSYEGVFVSCDSDQQETVLSVRYTPSEKDEYLRCPGYPKPFLPTCASYTHVSIDGPTDSVIAGTPITLRARVEGGPLEIWPPKVVWTTSAGKIRNRDAYTITIDTTGLDGRYVTVKLDVGELPIACPTTASYKIRVMAPSKPVKQNTKQP